MSVLRVFTKKKKTPSVLQNFTQITLSNSGSLKQQQKNNSRVKTKITAVAALGLVFQLKIFFSLFLVNLKSYIFSHKHILSVKGLIIYLSHNTKRNTFFKTKNQPKSLFYQETGLLSQATLASSKSGSICKQIQLISKSLGSVFIYVNSHLDPTIPMYIARSMAKKIVPIRIFNAAFIQLIKCINQAIIVSIRPFTLSNHR